MPISFPRLGTFTFVMESIAQEMGRTDMIVPKKPTHKTRQLGSQVSPEWICTPFKMIVGSYIECLELGADELVGTLFVDYCRLGYYTPVAKLILEDMGYDFEFIYLNYDQPLDFIKNMKNRTKGLGYLGTFRAFQIGWVKNRFFDLTEKLQYQYGAIELEKGSAERTAEKIFRQIVETRGMCNIRKLRKIIPKIFEKEVEIDKKANPLKVGLVGELYAVIEPAINLDALKRLNSLGVESYCPITFRRWIDIGRKALFFKRQSYQFAVKKARPYVQFRLGGETQESLGYTMMFKEKGWDGVVHVYPFSCMPEIITRSIIPQLSRDIHMPILSLVLDEHTGEAGLQTRFEAFVDLLERRRDVNTQS